MGLVEALGLRPYSKTIRAIGLTLRGDVHTPPSRFGPSSLRQLRPRYSVPLWLGRAPRGRLVPITNLFNYRQPPPERGWSVRVTDVRDFRGGRCTYDSHNGTDFAVPPGTLVVAAAPGLVLRVSSEFDRGGLKVLIDHGDGLATSYNHLARATVRPGQRVRRGEPIALSGYSGIDALVTFPWGPPHVHFNVWIGGRHVDPFSPDDRPSLWRAHNAPTPASGDALDDDAFEPTRWDAEALDAIARAARHEGSRREIEGGATLAERAGAALLHLTYYPTRFDRPPPLYGQPAPRRPHLDLPFSHRDYDGVVFVDDARD